MVCIDVYSFGIWEIESTRSLISRKYKILTEEGRGLGVNVSRLSSFLYSNCQFTYKEPNLSKTPILVRESTFINHKFIKKLLGPEQRKWKRTSILL